MIKNLDFLESEIPESLFLQAEDILEQEALIEIKNQERNLHIYQCDSHEIEVLMSPRYVKKYTCDCADFKRGTLCAHIAAVLLLIRRKRAEKQAIKQAKSQKGKSSISKLSVDAIIDHIDPKILLAFMKQYAKKNNKFDTALKVHFARRVPVEDVASKYRSILDKVLRPLTGLDEKYSVPSINYFIKNGLELFEQYKDAASLKSYVEAATIITLLLKKCAYAIMHGKMESDALHQFNQSLHDQVWELLQSDIAPELRTLLEHQLLDIVSLSYYHFPHIQKNVAYYLIQQSDQVQLIHLQERLTERLKSVVQKHVYSDICALILLLHQKTTSSYQSIFDDLKAHHLQRIFKHLLRFEMMEGSYAFIEACKQVDRLDAFSFKEIEILLARKEDRSDLLLPLLSDKYIHQKSYSILQELFEFDQEESRPYLEKILRSIRPQLAYSKHVLDIYQQLEDYDLLVDYALKHDLYAQMSEYMNVIFQNAPNLLEFYLRKYKEKCLEDSLHAHRNQIYILRNMDEIEDAATSNHYLNELRAFKKELEKEEVE